MHKHTNLMRTGVGVESVRHLHEIQSDYRRLEGIGGEILAFFDTRNTPQRANDLINGGSVYWIIKQQICARQTIQDIQSLRDENDKKFCRIIMSPEIILTTPVPHRHIQGWRYFPPEKAPTDLYEFDPTQGEDAGDIDPQMAKDLSELGLL